MNNIFEQLGGRKMVMALILILVLTVLAIFKPESITTEFISGILGIMVTFSGANALTTIKTSGISESPEPTINLDEIKEEIKVNSLATDEKLEQLKTFVNDTVAQQFGLITQQNNFLVDLGKRLGLNNK